MLSEEQINVLKKTIEKNGNEIQSIMCMEECAEMTQCISKALRGKLDKEHLIEEMGDVLFSIETLKLMYNITDEELEKSISYKVDRVKTKLNM